MSETLVTFSNAMSELVATVGQQVVGVEARQRLPASGIIWSADGVIVTAHHVVEYDENIGIHFADGRQATARLIGRDPGSDLAVLRTDQSNLMAATWLDAANVRVGNLVLAVGRPGKTVQATLGIISALGDEWRTPGGAQVDRYVQTDVVMYPGFSGGPLVSAGGQIIGVNTSALVRGVSVAVPAATVRKVVDTLLAHGKVPHGYLGVSIQPVRLSDMLQQQLGQETALMIMSVEPGSPAGQAGIVQGDVLVWLDGNALRHADELQGLLTGDRVGKALNARLVRGGQLQEINVTIGQGK